MNSKRTILKDLFLSALIAVLFGAVFTACSEDKDELAGGQYGYVQFKLYKQASYVAGEGNTQGLAVTRANALDKLGDVRKVEIEMQYEGKSITQTLVLNSYSDANAEYGMRSDKLQLLVGEYKILSCRLFDKLDNVVPYNVTAANGDTFSVVSRGMTVKDLTTDAQARGTVTFKFVKSGLSTRASGDTYLFSDIKIADVTVMNTFTRVQTLITDLKVNYKEDSKENQNPDNLEDKYMDTGYAISDSVIWLPAGNYQVTKYTVYKKTGSLVTTLDTKTVQGEAFEVKDNQLTKEAQVPIQLSEQAEYIKDYIALKEIWEALNGPSWSFYGYGANQGGNWNFNKEIDMWGQQPGVQLNSQGRVIGLSLEGFGASGRVPDAIGQLTELEILALGTHGEELKPTRLFNAETFLAHKDPKALKNLRMDYKSMFLDYDPRENLSELLQSSINADATFKPIQKDNRIHLKDTQVGHCANNITFVSKAVMRLTNLRQFYLANSPFLSEDICMNWENPESEYAKKYATENLSWKNFSELTDIEVYNCPKMLKLPAFLYELPKLTVINLACNPQIKDMEQQWEELIAAGPGKKLQIIYMGYNSLEQLPSNISEMEELGFLDCTYNKLKGRLRAFGEKVTLANIQLGHNEIEEIPENFCAFTDEVEGLGFSHNKLKYIPNIFNAASVYTMSSVNFSHNLIGSEGGKNINCSLEEYKGINASTIDLSYNQISNYPKELFVAGSPITTLNLSNNRMTEVPEYSMRSKEHNYKNSHLLQIIDMRFNKLTKLCDDFRATTLPYLTNMDVSYNCFSKFPTEPLNSSQLKAFGIRHQRDEAGNRILREWPEGITNLPSLLQLQIGSNDIRKIKETLNPQVYVMEIKDNPNISLDVTHLCPYIEAGMYLLIYDKTQDIRGCDALEINR